jgi:hypothetical protein
MSSERNNLPENSKIIDNSVFSSIINRLETVEKKETGTVNNEVVTKLSEDVLKLTEQLSRIGDEGIKHNLAISKHTEQLFRFERELVETKDILKTFMIKYDLFAADTNNKFSDYEFALSELERSESPFMVSYSTSPVFNSVLPVWKRDEIRPIPRGMIHSSTCVDFSFFSERYRDAYQETGTICPADADLWMRLSETMARLDIKGKMIKKLTCFHEDEGYSSQ